MNPKYTSWRLLNQLTSTRQRRWALGSLFFVLVLSIIFFTQRFRDTGTFNLPKWKGISHILTPPNPPPVDLDQPPTYERLKKWEMDLPQHNLDLPFPEGRTGRYVLFKNQNVGLGWNNVLNEV